MRPSLSLTAILLAHATAQTVSSPPPESSTPVAAPTILDSSTLVEEQICWAEHDPWKYLKSGDECCPSLPSDATSSLSTGDVASTPSETQTSSEGDIGTPNAQPTPSPEGEEPFVSFEEWKKMKMAEEDAEDKTTPLPAPDQATQVDTSQSPTDPVSSSGATSEKTDSSSVKHSDASSKSPVPSAGVKSQTFSSSSQSSSHQPSATPLTHHHNKYNYASPDCSARIHSASPQTQQPSSLLHKSRDRYMLTPCRANEHWVVVELCDEIRIEAVEIAVWEFFSGVVREVRISVGGEDEEEDEDDPNDDVQGRGQKWKEVGSFVGRNVRGSQTFKLSSPTSFHRFIRLDFPSYYGSEYYCPVSALKVYGLNQMEAFKWEQKQFSAIAKEKDRNGYKEKEKEQEERRARERQEKEKKEVEERDRQQQREKELDALEKLLHEQAGRLNTDTMTDSGLYPTVVEEKPSSPSAPETAVPVSSDPKAIENETDTRSDTLLSSVPSSVSTSQESFESSSTTPGETSSVTPSSKPSDSPTTPPSSTTSTYTRSPPPRSDSSESIYAFIIRRLNALEGNSSLVARYIEEQAKVMRSMLKRVETGWDEWKGDWEGDDRWRWQQERMRQEDRLGKVMSQLEQQRAAFENERKVIQTQLRVLADELSYERRRGIAQLIVMITAIVLGVASQSRTIDAFISPLLTEARRRKNIYDRKSISGPLTGLRIDMGAGRPPAIIGQPRPRAPSDSALGRSPTSPTPTPKVKGLSRHGSSSTSNRRPTTPGKKRAPQLVTPAFRSVSDARYDFASPIASAPNTALDAAASLVSPRPRVSFPGNPRAPPRKLARSSHLHTMEADRVRGQVQSSGYDVDGSASDVVKRRRPRSSLANGSIITGSPGFHRGNDENGAVSDRTVEDSQGEWGTETDFETEASASEIDSEMDRGAEGEPGISQTPPSYPGVLLEKEAEVISRE